MSNEMYSRPIGVLLGSGSGGVGGAYQQAAQYQALTNCGMDNHGLQSLHQIDIQKLQLEALMGFQQAKALASKPKERTMFQEIVNDVKTFVRDHRGVIYFVACAILIDHFIFKGAFKDRLQAMASKIVGKVEAKLDQ